ncbi:tripartite tricarboxylate transporter TctB family protein [Rhabdaerophilum calidifontis]|uniref:tripartite tricarboxylate transporter TctB family protein n=1 Tax=Rhabdaerophilum calidifontis TaxID=2604328 RepID=UPI00123B3ED8|nr:tripartite tricarboxylate transporter TctB family protein [Rhabdaerophilum calidifontis]
MTIRPALPELFVGLGVLALAALVGWATAAIPQSTYARISPAAFPWAITAGLAALGALLTIEGLRGGWEHDEGTVLDLPGILWLGTGLAANLLLIDGLSIGETVILPRMGFIIASTILFACTARAFGSRRFLRDLAFGLVLTIVAYIGFDRVLGYQIGSGIIERFL